MDFLLVCFRDALVYGKRIGLFGECLRGKLLDRCSSDEGMACELKGEGLSKLAHKGHIKEKAE